MTTSRTTEDLLGGMWEKIQEVDAIPARLLWDNETAIGRGKLTEAASAFAAVLGTEIKILPPRDRRIQGHGGVDERLLPARFHARAGLH